MSELTSDWDEIQPEPIGAWRTRRARREAQKFAWAEYAERQQHELHRLVNTHGTVEDETSWAYSILDYAHRFVQGLCRHSDHYSRSQIANLREVLDKTEKWLDEQRAEQDELDD
jgi:hypothetical protein